MNRQECRERLSALLREQIEGIEAAGQRLEAIRDAIAENHADALQQSLLPSDLGIEALQQLDRQRHALLGQYGFDGDAAGHAACVEWCDPGGDELAGLSARLGESLVRLQQGIQLGNLLVGKGRDRIRRSLGVLTGQTQAGQCKTYRSDGKTEQGPGRRDIAVA